MATLILGTVGRAIGGPIGGLVGTVLGGTIDRGLFGGGKTREGPRLANLAVQSAAYGEPLPRIYGRMRVAGNLVWTAGIRETRSRSGSAKSGTATNTYSYSSSFAVIVAGRAIERVERIWADGKVLRAADGTLNFPATIRTYRGDEAQVVDPLIAAAETVDLAPAYRGRAYVVFEDLPLADYGNRIPNLTFEVVADEDAVDVGTIAADLAAGAVLTGGSFPTIAGFAAAAVGSQRQALTALGALADLTLRDDGAALRVGPGQGAAPIPAADLGATDRGAVPMLRETRDAAAAIPDAVWLSYGDLARDYQTGIQAATRRSPARHIEQVDVTAAAAAVDMKQAANGILRRAIAARCTAQIAVPWRYAGLRPGDLIRAGDDAVPWRITHRTISGALIEFDLARVATDGTPAATDPGRAFVGEDAPPGPTLCHVLDIPALPGTLPTVPQLRVAVSGTSARWRHADILLSRDGGDSYGFAAASGAPATIGTVLTVLPPGTTTRWDRRSTLVVTLANAADLLQSVDEAAVLAGANLAVVGDELIQFATATAIGDRTYRLDTLLRGRRASEAAVIGHTANERFVLLDSAVATIDLPPEAVGATILLKAVGVGDDPAALPSQTIVPRGVALQPLSPVAVNIVVSGAGDRLVTWRRRSRLGFAWTDGTDAPLAEDSELYRATVSSGSQVIRQVDLTSPEWRYLAADFAVDAGFGPLTLAVAQVSATVGPGRATIVALV